MNSTTEVYDNPLITRYASKEMSAAFSREKRVRLFRQLWIALAEGEKNLGLNITDDQIDDMKKFANNLNLDVADKHEKEVRHDVMAQIHAFGQQATLAAPIIHLGATSNFVNDNADLIMYREALLIIKAKLINVAHRLSQFSDKYKNLPVLGFTHFQPAQLTTAGKRATLWLQDIMTDLEDIDALVAGMKLRGCKGATGTQGSFLELFEGDEEKVKALDMHISKSFGFKGVYEVTGQTYPRKFDYKLLNVLSGVAQSAYKFSNDLRLLQSLKEIEEPFEKNQVGSSAMPYKRNPMRSERISSLARFVISQPINAAVTASTQWFERTLDDSANKRIVIPQVFLALDGLLSLYMNVTENLVVYEKVIEKHTTAELPFMASELILMECVKAGGDRQKLHKRMRDHSVESAKIVKEMGGENDLISRIKSDKEFAAIHNKLDGLLDPVNFVGRAVNQVSEYLAKVAPYIIAHKDLLVDKTDVTV